MKVGLVSWCESITFEAEVFDSEFKLEETEFEAAHETEVLEPIVDAVGVAALAETVVTLDM